jgi:hypothetical protein
MPQLTQTKQSGKLSAVLSEAAKPFRSPAFDRVREDQNLVKRVWSPEQIKDLCELVCSGNSLSELKDRTAKHTARCSTHSTVLTSFS